MFADWRRDLDATARHVEPGDMAGYLPAPTQRGGRPVWRTVKFPASLMGDGQNRWDHLPVVGIEPGPVPRECVIFHRRVYVIQCQPAYNEANHMAHVRVAIAMVRRLPGAQ